MRSLSLFLSLSFTKHDLSLQTHDSGHTPEMASNLETSSSDRTVEPNAAVFKLRSEFKPKPSRLLCQITLISVSQRRLARKNSQIGEVLYLNWQPLTVLLTSLFFRYALLG